jgi:hypothetical protein
MRATLLTVAPAVALQDSNNVSGADDFNKTGPRLRRLLVVSGWFRTSGSRYAALPHVDTAVGMRPARVRFPTHRVVPMQDVLHLAGGCRGAFIERAALYRPPPIPFMLTCSGLSDPSAQGPSQNSLRRAPPTRNTDSRICLGVSTKRATSVPIVARLRAICRRGPWRTEI